MEQEKVSRTSKCKRCDSEHVAWQQNKNGKWYLTEVFKDKHDFDVTSYRDFHSKYCGKPELHAAEQANRNENYQAERDFSEEHQAKREQDRADAEAAQLRLFIEMSEADRLEHIEELKDKLEKMRLEQVSMDYFSEHCKHEADKAALAAEIDLFEDFMEDLA